MSADNKIGIPWYRRNIKSIGELDNGIKPLSLDFKPIPKPRPKPNPKPRRPITEPVPEPATQPAKQPSTQPSTNPITNPVTSPFLNPVDLPNQFPTPFPLPPFGDGKRNPNKNPQGQPTLPAFPAMGYDWNKPISSYTPEQKSWGDNFIKQVERVAHMTGIGADKVYSFLKNYNYNDLTVPQFNRDATNEFGAIAATMLTILIVGKSLIGLWGKRAAMMFSPPINLDDDYFQQHFGKKNEF